MSDLIDRQKVLNTLDNADKFLDEERTVEKYKELLTECIEVLPSAENDGDLISRQAILDRTVNRNSVWNKITDSEGNNLENILNSIPSVENKGEQIPVSKWTPANDPPKESGRYLVYIVNEYDEELQYQMTADYIARPKPIEGLSPWYVDDECASDNVVAWMPLPDRLLGRMGKRTI